jgi:hypothetical protein
MSEHRLNEVVIERPRSGWRIKLKKHSGYKKHLEKLTKEASDDGLFRPYLIKPRHKTKNLSDHLGPLRRYLRSKVGHPWNEVHQELCQRLDANTLTGQHVLSHVWQYVERYTEFRDGVLYSKASTWKAQPLKSHYYDQFYVHPETGILCVLARNAPQPKASRLAQPPIPEIVVLDRLREYRNLAGIWYLITFAPLPSPPQEWVFDVLEGQIRLSDRKQMSRARYAIRKQQCSKKEIRTIFKRISAQ